MADRVLAEIERYSRDMTIAERVLAWARLARAFPDNVACCYDPSQIRNACRAVRNVTLRQAEVGAGSLHSGDPDVRRLAMRCVVEELGVKPRQLETLNLDDFDACARTLKFDIPGRRSPVELSPATVEAVHQWLRIRPEGKGRLFCACHARCRREICASDASDDFRRCLARGRPADEQLVLEDLVAVFFERITPAQRRFIVEKLGSGRACSEALVDRLRSRAAADGTTPEDAAPTKSPATLKTVQQRERRMAARIGAEWNKFIKCQDEPEKRRSKP